MSIGSGSEHKERRVLDRALHHRAVFALAVLCAVGVKSASAQCQYEVTAFVENIPCEPIGPVHVRFYGLNEHGQACGSRGKCTINIDHNTPLPIVWTPELGLITLPLPPGATNGVANDINDVLGSDGFGQVVCTISGGTVGPETAYLYDDGVWTTLGTLPGFPITRPHAINDASEVVGEAFDPTRVNPFIAFQWREGKMWTIDLPLGPESSACCVNGFSSIAGWMGESLVNNDGFIVEGESVEGIPPSVRAITAETTGLNQWEVATGSSRIPAKQGPAGRRSWVFDGEVLIDLGVLSGTTHAASEDINDAGQIVGRCFTTTGVSRPFIWQNGVLTNIRDLYPGPPSMVIARAINNRGQIAGDAGNGAMILTPIVLLGDVNLDCQVNGDDLAIVLFDWGPNKLGHIADIVTSATFQPPGDGVVDGADLAVVLGNWTERPSTSSRRN